MRVLVTIFEKLLPISGGGTPRISSLVKALVARGHDVHVASSIAVAKGKAIEQFDCQGWVSLQGVNRLGRWKMAKYTAAYPYNIMRVAATVGRLRPDLVVSHNSIAGYAALLGKRFSPATLTVLDLTDLLFEYLGDYSKGGWLRAVMGVGRRLENRAVRGSDRIVTISEAMKDIAVQYGAAPDRIDVVPDGVDTSIFRRVDGSAVREAHAPRASHVLIFHGAIDPQDDPGLLVEAARLVLSEHQGTRFWLVGDGSAVPDLKRKVAQYSLDSSFFFSGWVDQREIPAYISASDIGLVVLPDVLSARGRVTLKEFEYWACGVPAILPRLPALQEVADEGETALFFRPGDADDLAAKIIRLLEDRELRERLGERGLARVKDRFEWSKLAHEFVHLCEQYVQGSRSQTEAV